MILIEQSVGILDIKPRDQIIRKLEVAARTAYKSKISETVDQAAKFLQNLIKMGHESVLEHESISFFTVTDRNVTHEMVRHRIAAYTQESQRYVSYRDVVEFMTQPEIENFSNPKAKEIFLDICERSEQAYKELLEAGVAPQTARSVLLGCCKTEIVSTMNIRELRHFLKLRTHPTAHPNIRGLGFQLLKKLNAIVPELFFDIKTEEDYFEENSTNTNKTKNKNGTR